MKCIVHIGTEKTATTTLQSFCNINRKKLYKNKCIYTKSAGNTNNKKLTVAAYNLDRRDHLTRKLGVYTNQELQNLQTKIISNLKQELSELVSPKISKIVFSSEHIQSRLTTVEEVKRLKTILNDLGFDDISILIYLREPAYIANSSYSTSIKSGSTIASPPPPTDNYYNNICNHKNTLKLFASVFGESSIIPRIFERNELINGSIIDDFLSTIELPNLKDYQLPTNRNESLSMTGIEILRRFNQKIPHFIDSKVNPLRGDIVQYIQKHYADEKYVMSNELFKQYHDAFQASNEWVRKKYFSEKKSLFSPKPCPNETNLDISETQLDLLANLIVNIWQDKQRKIINLKNKQKVKAKLNPPKKLEKKQDLEYKQQISSKKEVEQNLTTDLPKIPEKQLNLKGFMFRLRSIITSK